MFDSLPVDAQRWLNVAWSQLAPYYADLAKRPLEAGNVTAWLEDWSRLAELGHDPASIARIACPIGDPALGKHPQAIAVGVAAALLSSRAKAQSSGNQTA